MRPPQLLPCLLTALSLLAACERRPGPAATQASDTPAAVAPTDPASEPPSTEESVALGRLAEQWPPVPEQPARQRVRHELMQRLELPAAASRPRFLLVYASRQAGHDCSACSPDLSFFEFEPGQAGQPPRLVMASVAAASLGYAGEAPSAKVQALGGERYAVLLSWDIHAQGTQSMLAVLTPIGGRMVEVLQDQVGGQHDELNQSGDLSVVDWETAIRFQPGPGPYLDLHLRRRFIKGRRWLLDPVRGPFASELTARGQVPTELVYRFDGQRMKLVMSR